VVERFDGAFDDYDPHFVTKTRASGSQARIYLRGLMQARRRNIERIRDVVPGSDEQALQHFISNSPWDHRPVLDHVARDANALLGGTDDSFLVIDETGFPKKGRDSVGVARQWCGRLGKVDNCQTAVCASLGKGSIATLIDTALFLPKEWTGDRKRMTEAGVPESAQTYRTKQELALDLIERALLNGVQFSWVGFDGFYGDNGQLLRMLDETGLTFMGDVHCDQYIWTADPTIDSSAKRMRADAWVDSQSADQWRRIQMRRGTKGPMEVEALHDRVWLYQHGDGQAYQWHLIVTRQPNRLKYSLSNAAPETPVQRLAYMQGQRYFVERALEDAKQQGGFGEYQVRGWRGWHHHAALVMMAMLFLTRERLEIGEPVLTAADVQMMLVHYLPRRDRTPEDLIELLRRRFKRRGESFPVDPPEK
jgi:SRSO17 transposase